MKATADAAVATVRRRDDRRRRRSARPSTCRWSRAATSRSPSAARGASHESGVPAPGRRRAPVVRRVHERHHRQAEGRRARPRRLRGQDRGRGGVPGRLPIDGDGWRSDDVLFWLTDLGWIMGPWQIFGTLAWGGTMFCYDGAPDIPAPTGSGPWSNATGSRSSASRRRWSAR